MNYFFRFFKRIYYYFRYFNLGGVQLYFIQHPKVKKWVQLQVSSPNTNGESAWLFWDDWPLAWRNRVEQFYQKLRDEQPLPVLDEPLIFTVEEKQAKGIVHLHETNIYKDHDVAREVYFAHVAHAIYLDTENIVSWKLNTYSENELQYLMSSANIMSMIKLNDGQEVYANQRPGQENASRAIIGNPRVPYLFLKNEPEQEVNLIGNSQEATIGNLSAWMADYLYHNPGPPYSYQDYMSKNPYLTNRLQRQTVFLSGEEQEVYLSPLGCWAGSDFVADLLRAVNIPIQKVTNRMEHVSLGSYGTHSGIIYNWQGGGGRYLLHTDSLFTEGLNFIPTFPGERPGTQILNYNWLNPTDYGKVFTYLGGEEDFSEAPWVGIEKYKSRARHLLPLKDTVYTVLQSSKEEYSTYAQEAGLTPTEADANYDRLETMLLAHGNGNKTAGMEKIDQLYDEWVERTGKTQ